MLLYIGTGINPAISIGFLPYSLNDLWFIQKNTCQSSLARYWPIQVCFSNVLLDDKLLSLRLLNRILNFRRIFIHILAFFLVWCGYPNGNLLPLWRKRKALMMIILNALHQGIIKEPIGSDT